VIEVETYIAKGRTDWYYKRV